MHKVNQEFFSKWSNEMAYVLGFFAADGCMVHGEGKGYSVIFDIKDLDHLENIRQIMGYKGPTRNYGRSTSSIIVGSKKMYNSLLRVGMSPRKSLTLQYPSDIPKEYEWDFIRGVFDGDGWISTTGTAPLVGFCSGSRAFLLSLKQRLENLFSTVTTKYHPLQVKKSEGNTFSLYITGIERLRLLFQRLYANSTKQTRLERKYEHYSSCKIMYCYVIPPISRLSLMDRGDRYFCLAHLFLQNQKYRSFFQRIKARKRPKKNFFITLDNSAAERSLVTEDVLLEIIKQLQPDEVISPDVLFDKEATLRSLRSFIDKMKRQDLLEKTKIFGCPQGSTQKEWLECYKEMLKIPEVSVIGLSKISVPFCWLGKKDDQGIKEARQKCVQYLIENNLLLKPIHFLGMGDPTEFIAYNHILLRSTDSCYSILAAQNNVVFGETSFKRVGTTNKYFESFLSSKQVALAKKNIWFLRDQLGCKTTRPKGRTDGKKVR